MRRDDQLRAGEHDDDPEAGGREAFATLESRILRLERSAGRWRRAALAAGLGLVALVAAGQTTAPRVIEAPAIVARDPGGKARVQLTASEGVPSLSLYDATGTLRAGIVVDAEGPQWNLMGPDGEARVVAGQRGGAAFVIVRDAEGAPRAAIAVQESGEPSLYLLDAHLNPIFRKPDAPGPRDPSQR